jgi:spore maturation protein CgeB
LRLLYIAARTGNAELQRRALERLGHEVVAIDPFGALPGPFLSRWHYQTGGRFLAGRVADYIRARTPPGRFDVALVDQGEVLDRAGADWLGAIARRTVLMCKDNPFSGRDGARFRLLLQALPSYDLFVTFRESSAEAALRAGARQVRRIFFMADEVAHRLRPAEEPFAQEIAFVGAWMPERGPFFRRLLDRGLPVHIFGARWDRDPAFRRLRGAVTLGALGSEDYAKTIARSRICIGLCSKGNLDLHTSRSLEIPSIGRLLCAERTADHLALYEDGVEAVFWDDAEQCADLCQALLADPERVERIAAAGHARALANGHFNEPVLTDILQQALRLPGREG